MSQSDFIIYKSKHIQIERDFIRPSAGGQRKWMSFGIHFDWQKPHFIIYFANTIITIGNTTWGDPEGGTDTRPRKTHQTKCFGGKK